MAVLPDLCGGSNFIYSMKNIFSKILGLLSSKNIINERDDIIRLRVTVITLMILLIICVASVYAARNIFINYYKTMPAHVALIIICLLCLLELKYIGNYKIPARLVIILPLIASTFIVYTSHDISRTLPWYGIVPLGCVLIIENKFERIFWIALSFTIFYLTIGFGNRDIFFDIYTTLFAIMVAYSMLSYVHSYSYSQIFQKLNKTIADNSEKQNRLIEMAHIAGQADVAANTLHNVGNILNSIMVSAETLDETQKKSSLAGLRKANGLLMTNINNLEDFIINNPKGKKLMEYYLQLEKNFLKEHENGIIQLQRIQDKIQDINQVIKGQEKFLHSEIFLQNHNIIEIIKDVLTIIENDLKSRKINVVNHFDEIPNVKIQKTKLVNILTNIINNAADAMEEVSDTSRDLHIFVQKINNEILIKIKDSGCGIPENHIKEIFFNGFTTKANADGFGLHTCANHMKEMNGTISADSDGPDKGTTITLKFQA